MTSLYRASDSGGVIRLADSAHIPARLGNRDWDGYLAYVDEGGTTDAVEAPDLTAAKALATKSTNEKASALRLAATPAEAQSSDGAVWLAMRFAEAVACAADLTPTAPEYPLLAAEIPEKGANVDEVADAVVAIRTAYVTAVAAIENARATGVAAIAAAADVAAVDSAVLAISWP